MLVEDGSGAHQVAAWPTGGTFVLADVASGSIPMWVGAASPDQAVGASHTIDESAGDSTLWQWEATLRVFAPPYDRHQADTDAVATLTSPWLPNDGLGAHLGDLDGDAVDDVLVSWTSGASGVVWAPPAGGAATWGDLDQLLTLGVGFSLRDVADLDGDGVAELLVGTHEDGILVFDGPVSPGSTEGEAATILAIPDKHRAPWSAPGDHGGAPPPTSPIGACPSSASAPDR